MRQSLLELPLLSVLMSVLISHIAGRHWLEVILILDFETHLLSRWASDHLLLCRSFISLALHLVEVLNVPNVLENQFMSNFLAHFLQFLYLYLLLLLIGIQRRLILFAGRKLR